MAANIQRRKIGFSGMTTVKTVEQRACDGVDSEVVSGSWINGAD